MQYIRQRDAREGRILGFCEFLERSTDFDVFFPRRRHVPAFSGDGFALLFGFEIAASEGTPGHDAHALSGAHG